MKYTRVKWTAKHTTSSNLHCHCENLQGNAYLFYYVYCVTVAMYIFLTCIVALFCVLSSYDYKQVTWNVHFTSFGLFTTWASMEDSKVLRLFITICEYLTCNNANKVIQSLIKVIYLFLVYTLHSYLDVNTCTIQAKLFCFYINIKKKL